MGKTKDNNNSEYEASIDEVRSQYNRPRSLSGLWKEPVPRAPPPEPVAVPVLEEPGVDYEFFDKTCV